MPTLFLGAVIDDKQGDEIRITVIATGFTKRKQRMGLETREIQSLVNGEELEIPSVSTKKREERLISNYCEKISFDQKWPVEAILLFMGVSSKKKEVLR